MEIKVAELFAGVGGFRLGLENSSREKFNFVYVNQWEPGSKIQHAFNIYINNFNEYNNENVRNEDIALENLKLEENSEFIPNFDFLVGGFPCQDYSVAATKAKGIEGKKGVLWWEIYKILKIKLPKYFLFENVDRLLISPSKQRGRDFLIMLKTVTDLGYNVEWRIIDASKYSNHQKRKRVFIFGYKKNLKINLTLNNSVLTKNLEVDIIQDKEKDLKNQNNRFKNIKNIKLKEVSDKGFFEFGNYGYILNGKISSFKIKEREEEKLFIDEILESDSKKLKEFVIPKEQLEKIRKLKSSSSIERITKDGFKYKYSVGKMILHDNDRNKPSRTMLTSESTINRSTHVIKMKNNQYRFITPIEAERLNGFPDDWTKLESVPKRMRYFIMGNALVVNLITRIGNNILEIEALQSN